MQRSAIHTRETALVLLRQALELEVLRSEDKYQFMIPFLQGVESQLSFLNGLVVRSRQHDNVATAALAHIASAGLVPMELLRILFATCVAEPLNFVTTQAVQALCNAPLKSTIGRYFLLRLFRLGIIAISALWAT